MLKIFKALLWHFYLWRASPRHIHGRTIYLLSPYVVKSGDRLSYVTIVFLRPVPVAVIFPEGVTDTEMQHVGIYQT